jgi:hypothetical protein
MDEPVKTEQTPDAQVEFAEKQKLFLKEYGELVAKHKIDYATYPVWIPDGQGGFKCIVQNTPIDITNQPRKSPFVAS